MFLGTGNIYSLIYIPSFIVLLCLLASPIWAQDFDKGMEAYQGGNYELAFQEFYPLAEQGLADAQLIIGLMYDKGQGLQHDYVKAAKWYKKAAEQGLVPAQTLLGFMYGEGRGVIQDDIKAHKWLNIAASQGVEDAAKGRDMVVEDMTSDQIAEAQRRAREWMEKHGDKLE